MGGQHHKKSEDSVTEHEAGKENEEDEVDIDGQKEGEASVQYLKH